jgi:hypothetical protein
MKFRNWYRAVIEDIRYQTIAMWSPQSSGREAMSRRLSTRLHLLDIMNRISNPKRYALTAKELEQAVEEFCAGCPDPIQAYSLIAENPDSMTDEEIVDLALSMAYLPISSVPTSIVPASHSVRAIIN